MKEEELLDRLFRGEFQLHQLDEVLGSSVKATEVRRRFLETKLGMDLSTLRVDLPYDNVVGRSCENTIGGVVLPLGVVGPITVRGKHAHGEFFVPLATTEGALVASVNRGCSAIRASGGAVVAVLDDGMTRAPVIETPGLEYSVELASWVRENFHELKRRFESTTSHGRLLEANPIIVGKFVYLRLKAFTGDAMGMNMVTKGSDEVVRLIEDRFGWSRQLALSSNACTDKKASAINWIMGRGKSVSAEAIIRREVVVEKLKTTPEAVEEVVWSKNFIGSARSGSLGGFNAHVANVVAAVFIATGQDPAQVVESSMSISYAERTKDGDLYISLTIPSLEVGTVGGGTWLPTQRKALEIMGVAGSGTPPGTNSLKFAEVLAGVALAGELSLLSAIASRHLAEAHMRLGRGEKL
ncbi:MAG: hydroxymethylglutaryl-CoA reductase (NADPH) [Aigarchaeota archaeon]|nr:hydroxymethylglutaryl-CoA reductase (NADPH) [Aigarchaeota archaeon]MDW8092585.1 hydroxymethylglutaryl-CoA reductase (NADPH) [Nitrososphaerota archaeon]